MAYKQTPGRGNGKKTGAGLSPMLMGGSPMYQKLGKKEQAAVDKAKKEEERVDRAVNKYSSTKKMKGQDLQIERAAAYDSIAASDKARNLNFSAKEAAKIGNKSANETRKINDGATRVTRTPSGYSGKPDTYKRVNVTPNRQMSKLKSGKSPAKQMSKMPAKKVSATITAERTLAPKADKKAPMKMKKC